MKKRDSPEPRLCGGCGSSERRLLLHYVRLHGSFQRLCTNCLLKTHPGLFCPFCLDLFNLPPPPRVTVTCATCPSVAHRSCVNNGSSFECPPCSNSSFSFFSGAGEFAGKKKQQQQLGKDSAKAFVAAAKIAASSMRKAAAEARSNAERRVREVVAAKKRAREALEVLAILVNKENEEERGEKEKAKSEATQGLANMATCMATRPSEFRSNAVEEGG